MYKELIVNLTSEKKVEKESNKNITNALHENNKKIKAKCPNGTLDTLENEIFGDEFVVCEVPSVDNGTALILTPYIEKGQILEAREASRVNPDVFLGVESYSGFFTVNKTYDSNIFFWYFPVQNKPVNETPWIVWLQGGPGASSMTGLFDEIGPFKISPGGNLKCKF